ncbi:MULTISPECIES: glycosyltransferase [unclassified Thiothrix]|uniref:glycosyltransferase n=1 Tax=unclassified Thiothrix TaxID=2636184 RepID=UPI0032E3C552
MLNHLKKLAENYRVTVCINADEVPVSSRLDPRVSLINLPITRQVNLYNDLSVLFRLIRFFQTERFDAVHSLTPKGGLLGMIAALIAQIPVRTHSFTGQVWATRSGVSRYLLKSMDKILARCATHLNADSYSQVKFLQQEKVTGNTPIHVFGAGSISGVDVVRFSANPSRRQETRQQLDIPKNTTVFLFLGRMNHDKGIKELSEAFVRLHSHHQKIHLIFVGRDEQNMIPAIQTICRNCMDSVSIIGLTPEPERYIDAADVLCLPSYREGFGSSIIEAAAMGVPSIASRIYGITDAIVEGKTGLLFAPGNIDEIQLAMQTMLDETIRKNLSNYAQERAKRDFSAERITQDWLDYYAAVLNQPKKLQ